jgi:DNA-binding winged helix-turn-helix (wHTH) protein
LLKALWPRGYVAEATLSNHIWQIRRALGDSAKATRSPRYWLYWP